MLLALHEIQHSLQYIKKGGEENFLSEYILHAAGQVVSRRSFNIHDWIPIEQDAISRSQEILEGYGWNLWVSNKCAEDVHFYTRYKGTDGQWVTTGFATALIPAGEYGTLAKEQDDGSILMKHSLTPEVYFYAETDSGKVWSGDTPITIFTPFSRTLNFIKESIDLTNSEYLSFSVLCSN